MNKQKYYAVGTTTPEAWEYVHGVLTQDGSLDDNIPARPIECTDLKDHSPTRAVYLMTDAEAAQISLHPDVKFIQLNIANYPDLYPPKPEEMHSARYSAAVKNYRGTTSVPTISPTSAETNRAGYQLYRSAQYANPWQGQSVSTVLSTTIPYTNTGKNIDLIVGDDGCWFGHVEFQSDVTGNIALPNDFVSGNKLPGNGTCNVLDVVLEGPYYIDSAWFDASAGTRLTTRWDGTTVPVESVAREWWGNASARSSQFSTAGTVAVPATYTRANCNGTNATVSVDGTHGTPCAGQAYGRTYGWAYNANKWFIDAYGSKGFGLNVDLYFDVMKIFHVNKPINALYGTQDPTISSNSWGFRETIPDTGYYYFRQGTSGSGSVAYTGTKPAFMYYLGSAGDLSRAKGEMLDNNLTTAGDELIAAGVIFIVAAGNANQKQVGSSDADFNNYWSVPAATPLASATHTALDNISLCYNTTNRRGFPQQLGKYTSGSDIVYPVINIGALDDDFTALGLEQKVNYSDMGNQIDCYSPGDGTLGPARGTAGYGTMYPRYDSYTKAIATSTGFSGICSSSALLTTTGTFSVVANTGNQITTSTGTATVVGIASSLFGGTGLSSSITPYSGTNDDGYWLLSLPFNITYNGISYASVNIGTNSYLTFGAGSSVYSNLSASNPPVPKIMITAADNSAQRIYYGSVGSAPNRTYRVRWEGTNATGGTLGSPNMVWEATFYEASPTQINIQIGVNAKSEAAAIFYDTRFGGTSSACPTATGLIATALEVNRSWTWQDVRTWLQSLTTQDAATFYQGPDPATATSTDWADLNSLMGGVRKVGYNNIAAVPQETITISGSGLTISGASLGISSS